MAYSESDLSQLELEDEARRVELSVAEKRALIKEAKRRYGGDTMSFFKRLSSGGSGMDWQALKFRMQ